MTGQLDYTIFVKLECVLVLYLGVLRLMVNCRQKVAVYGLEILLTTYLLWATFTRQWYLQITQVEEWASGICMAILGYPILSGKGLLFNYFVITVLSWISSSFLEYTSFTRFAKLYSTRLNKFTPNILKVSLHDICRSRTIVLLMAVFCTINSLFLTLSLWGGVHRSFKSVSDDTWVLAIQSVAAYMRLARQFMESITFIAGIATREFKWRNSKAEKLLCRITFSSFMLLIHTSVLTYVFVSQKTKVWSPKQYVMLLALLTDIIFRVVVCVWATFNSCCYFKLKDLSNTLLRISCCCNLSSLHDALQNIIVSITTALPPHFLTVRNIARYCYSILNFFLIPIITVLTLIIAVFKLAHYIVVLVLNIFLEAWRDYIFAWQNEQRQIEVEFEDPGLELDEPIAAQQVWQETQRTSEGIILFPSFTVQCQDTPHSNLHTQCPDLALAHIIRSRYSEIQPFGPSLSGYELNPPLQFPSRVIESQRDSLPTDMDSPLHLCQLEVFPEIETQQRTRQKERLVAPTSHTVLFIHNQQLSEVVV